MLVQRFCQPLADAPPHTRPAWTILERAPVPNATPRESIALFLHQQQAHWEFFTCYGGRIRWQHKGAGQV